MAACDAKLGKYFLTRDTTANWLSSDPVLCAGLLVYDETAVNFKIGNGTSKFSELPYLITGGGSGGGTEITDGAKKTALQLNTNWDNPARPHSGPPDEIDKYYFKYTGTAITGQSTHDFFIGQDEATLSWYEYVQLPIAGVTNFIRRPLQLS